MIAPGKLDIRCFQGASFDMPFGWILDGVAQSFTGRSLRMQVREDVDSNAVLVELTTANGKITLSGDGKTATLVLSPTETASLLAGRHVYDIEMFTMAETDRILEGRFVVYKEVTR